MQTARRGFQSAAAAVLGAMALLAPAAAIAQAGDWRGGYFGVTAGGVRGKMTWSTTQLGPDTAPTCPPGCLSSQDADIRANGYRYGVHIGYNWLLGDHVLLGVETGAGDSHANGSIQYTPGWLDSGQLDRITARFEHDGGIVGRAGFVAGPLLLYGIAGPWWQKVSIHYSCPSDPVGVNSWCLTGQTETKGDIRRGWVGGGGAEWRFANRWSARLDYRYTRYEDKDYSFFASSLTDVVTARTAAKTQALLLGLSYRFR